MARLRLDEEGIMIRFPGGAGSFSFLWGDHTVSGAYPSSFSMITGTLYPGIKPSCRETNHLPSTFLVPMLRMRGAVPPLSQMPPLRSTWLKHKENFGFLMGCLVGETTSRRKWLFCHQWVWKLLSFELWRRADTGLSISTFRRDILSLSSGLMSEREEKWPWEGEGIAELYLHKPTEKRQY
jgi:hypothetical protein